MGVLAVVGAIVGDFGVCGYFDYACCFVGCAVCAYIYLIVLL